MISTTRSSACCTWTGRAALGDSSARWSIFTDRSVVSVQHLVKIILKELIKKAKPACEAAHKTNKARLAESIREIGLAELASRHSLSGATTFGAKSAKSRN